MYLIRFCSDSLSIRLYLGYDLDEELPWHSTISRTRKLFGEEVFLSLFQEVLRLCCDKGMVSGKPRNLNYYGQIGVDTKNHVITGATSDFADKRDSQCLEKLTEQMEENLQQNHIGMDELLADTGYSSGEVLEYLERKNLNAWIPNFGQFKPDRKGFVSNKEKNQYECQRGNRAVLPYKNTRLDRGYNKMIYRSSEKDCKNCPLKTKCCGEKSKFKKISHSEYYQQYQRQHNKLTENEKYAKRMSRLRSSTVEPVLGTLLNFMGMKKIYARGIEQAEKHVLVASLCYNLKKMLKFRSRKAQIQVSYAPITEKVQRCADFLFFAFARVFFFRFQPL